LGTHPGAGEIDFAETTHRKTAAGGFRRTLEGLITLRYPKEAAIPNAAKDSQGRLLVGAAVG
jgi:hypothetical protein